MLHARQISHVLWSMAVKYSCLSLDMRTVEEVVTMIGVVLVADLTVDLEVGHAGLINLMKMTGQNHLHQVNV